MYLLAFIIVVFVPLITGSGPSNGITERVLTTETFVRRHGYPFEKHSVQTEDGYILELHRIPSRSKRRRSRRVAFLMHGLLCSSSDWVVSGRGSSLAFILADAGYDVWMGNARGNTYSRKHIKDNVDSEKFWKFSWHEIGIFDLPAMIDYVRYNTGVEQIRYFGHSQGTTAFFVLTSLKPEYNRVFKSAHLLAPVVFLSHTYNNFLKLGGSLIGGSILIQGFLDSSEFRPSRQEMALYGNALCTDNSEDRVLCNNVQFLFSGFDNETANTAIIPDIMASNPAGSSTNQVLHYMQGYVSGQFRQFDHGGFENLKAYGSIIPPDYPLENIDVPIFLYYSLSDNFVAIKDFQKLCKKLKTVCGTFENPIPTFDHLAHIYAENLAEKLHRHIMKDVASIA